MNIEEYTLEQIEELDFSKLSPSELDEIRTFSAKCSAHEQAIKLSINSIYGAFANEYFHFYNIAIAETVTLQGQDAIKFTEKQVDKYFKQYFHKDKPLLEHLGVTDFDSVPKIKGNVWKYTDTDSGYLIFEECMEAVKWEGSVKDFVMRLNDFRLAKFLKKILTSYADSFGVDNYLDFELETIAENAIWVAKKKYVQNIVWKDGKDYEKLSYIKTTGLEIIQSSTPLFCRNKLIEAVKFIFSKKKLTTKHNPELVSLIKSMKKEFNLSNIEKISMNRGISNFKKFVLNDVDDFVLGKGCPIHIRGGAHHNYLLNQNVELKNKYELIRGGDKVKWYHTKSNFNSVFSYKSGGYPYEIAPKIDLERQFQATIIDPLNRILTPTGLPPLNPSLAYTIGSLF